MKYVLPLALIVLVFCQPARADCKPGQPEVDGHCLEVTPQPGTWQLVPDPSAGGSFYRINTVTGRVEWCTREEGPVACYRLVNDNAVLNAPWNDYHGGQATGQP